MMSALLLAIHYICCLLIAVQAICAVNHMDAKTPTFPRVIWIMLAAGAFTSFLIPPGEPLWGHTLLLISTTAFIIYPGVLFVVQSYLMKFPGSSRHHSDHRGLPL